MNQRSTSTPSQLVLKFEMNWFAKLLRPNGASAMEKWGVLRNDLNKDSCFAEVKVDTRLDSSRIK